MLDFAIFEGAQNHHTTGILVEGAFCLYTMHMPIEKLYWIQEISSFQLPVKIADAKVTKMITGEYDDMLDTINDYKFDVTYSDNEKSAIKLLKYIINDYHANCEKPIYYTDANEHTPYCEYIVPVFKYFSAVYKNLSFMW